MGLILQAPFKQQKYWGSGHPPHGSAVLVAGGDGVVVSGGVVVVGIVVGVGVVVVVVVGVGVVVVVGVGGATHSPGPTERSSLVIFLTSASSSRQHLPHVSIFLIGITFTICTTSSAPFYYLHHFIIFITSSSSSSSSSS